jgi:iron complex transport system substrate-binding protein
MRICSFLPSATEIVYALGLGDSLSGITYECDYPPEARGKTVVVETRLTHAESAAQIDRQVSEFIGRGESLYRVNVEALQRIQPDLIITQDLCRVCAASPGDLAHALTALERAPQVLSLNPQKLPEVWNDILTVGKATGRGPQARALVAELERRVAAVERAVSSAPRRARVLCLEWMDPPFVGGHWVPEMVERAGGIDVMGRIGEPGFRVAWEKALETEPDVVVVMPCGYGLDKTVKEFKATRFPPHWVDLPAVRNGRVFAVDATSYFSRPGPRLADGVEILAYVCHPDRAPVTPSAGMVERLV